MWITQAYWPITKHVYGEQYLLDTIEKATMRLGGLDGGPHCRMSNLRNPHVDFKMGPCRMLIIRNSICHVVNNFPPVDRPH